MRRTCSATRPAAASIARPTAICATSVPALTWQAPRRFHLTDYRVFVLDDTALADKLGPLGKATAMKDGRTTIQFSAETDGELLPDGRIRMGKPRAGQFEELE